MSGPAPVSKSRRLLLAAAASGLLPGRGAAADDGFVRADWPAGRPTPLLDLPLASGGRWSLGQARGQVVVVNFWASWCGPCRSEMPSLQALATRRAGDGLTVVAVNYRETEGAIRGFIAETGLLLPILRDGDGSAARAWRVSILPSTAVIDRSGAAAFTVTGEIDWSGPQAGAWIDAMLTRPTTRM